MTVPVQWEQATRGAVRSARLGVNSNTPIYVGVIELGDCRAGLLPRPAQVLQHQSGQGERPSEGICVATADVFTGTGYLGLIGDAGPDADVVDAVVKERSAI